MKIIWLEDEPETIDVVKGKIKDICKNIEVCKSFASFSDEIEELEDRDDEVIIIDIRMVFNSEMEFRCFNKDFKIYKELDSGFEYFNECLKSHFKKAKIIFFSSKPQSEAQKDAIEYGIDTNLIISKDYTTQLIEKLREMK